MWGLFEGSGLFLLKSWGANKNWKHWVTNPTVLPKWQCIHFELGEDPIIYDSLTELPITLPVQWVPWLWVSLGSAELVAGSNQLKSCVNLPLS